MPVYEFRCRDCSRRFSVLAGLEVAPEDRRCPHCGSVATDKLVSRFSRGRTEDDRVDELADRLELYGEPDSPAAKRAMAREMGKAIDEDASEEMEELIEADLAGELPDDD